MKKIRMCEGLAATSFKALLKGAAALAVLPAVIMTWTAVQAQTTGGNVDPSAPLDVLKTARQTASNSNLNVASATTTGTNTLNIALIFFAVLGVILAGISGQKLYKNINDGDNARGSNASYIVALVVGALLTILSIIVGVITNFATGSGAA